MRQRARNRKAINAHRGDSSASAGSHVERVRLLKSEGTKKENKENKKKMSEAHLGQVFHRAH